MEPTDDTEVAIVAAGTAWPFYLDSGSYICQLGRTFRPVDYFGFYSSRTIHPLVARIVRTVPSIEISDAEAAGRLLGVEPIERRIGETVVKAMTAGWDEGPYTMYVLSGPDDPATVDIGEVRHEASHSSSAWTMGQRYRTLGALKQARTTADLP